MNRIVIRWSLNGRRTQGIVEIADCRVAADRWRTDCPHHAQQMPVPGGHAHFRNGSQTVGESQVVPCRRLQATSASQECIGGAVVDLPEIAERGGNRRKHHEVVKCEAARRAMKVECAVRLGCKNPSHRFGGSICQKAVIQCPGKVEDAFQRFFHLFYTAPDVVLPWDTSP